MEQDEPITASRANGKTSERNRESVDNAVWKPFDYRPLLQLLSDCEAERVHRG